MVRNYIPPPAPPKKVFELFIWRLRPVGSNDLLTLYLGSLIRVTAALSLHTDSGEGGSQFIRFCFSALASGMLFGEF